MRYEKIIAKIQSGSMTRAELTNLLRNASKKYQDGDLNAAEVIDAINKATPTDSYMVFMGFCPNADFNSRLDIEWKKESICRFDFLKSEHQLDRFNTICAGDLIVLKKREKFGKTMMLYGHGRVASIAYDEENIKFLKMEWSNQNQEIEVPLMGCNDTVNVRTIERVEGEMPKEFYRWLEV